MKSSATKERLHPLMWLVVGLSIASVCIFIAGLLFKPYGEVHPTIIQGMDVITADITLIIFAYAIVTGKTATFKHGNTSATVGVSKRKTDTDTE